MNRLRTSLILIVALLTLTASGSSSEAVANGQRSDTTQSAGSANVRVWVNTNSGVYHCPGTRLYGNTKSGRFMTQRELNRKAIVRLTARCVGRDHEPEVSSDASLALSE